MCIKKLAIDNKGFGQLISNETYFSDSWISFIKTAEEMAAVVVDYCSLVNTSHKVCFLATLENLMKHCLG